MTTAPAGFITDPDKKVQGSALYAEFKNPYAQVVQMFVTPDGIDEAGHFVNGVVFYRRLSATQPKKQWQIATLGRALLDEHGMTTEQVLLNRLETLEFLMKRIAMTSELVAKPFFVEVSKKDLADVRIRKTPTKIVYRIGQMKSSLNYPELFKA
jgi:hypothetical protein